MNEKIEELRNRLNWLAGQINAGGKFGSNYEEYCSEYDEIEEQIKLRDRNGK